jgi:hypothetical protein
MPVICVRTKAEYFCESCWTQHLADLPVGKRIRYFLPTNQLLQSETRGLSSVSCLPQAVALIAVAATAATLRPLPSKNHPSASAGIMSLSELKADVNKLATDDCDDQSFV